MIVGRHTVRVKYGGQEIPESPFLVPVAPSGRANMCRIESKINKEKKFVFNMIKLCDIFRSIFM